jgi:hypothetical protein
MPRASFLSVLTGREDRKRCACRVSIHDRYARLAKPPMEPLRQRAGLDPGKLDEAGPLRQPLGERAGLACNLTLPMHRAVVVDNADGSLGK